LSNPGTSGGDQLTLAGAAVFAVADDDGGVVVAGADNLTDVVP
jgi:hypothetical protein